MPITLKQIPFFQGLSVDELKAVAECLHEKSFEKGEQLFKEGGICERIFFVRLGRVKLIRSSSTGREQILEELGPGDTCACNPGSGEWHCGSTAIAMTGCAAWFLSRESYSHMIRTNPKLSQSLNRLFADKLKCMSSLVEEVSLKDSKKRVIKFLLDALADKKNDTLTLPLAREELAQKMGMARETLARQLHMLKEQKLIEITSRTIVIRDRTALQKLLL